MQRVRTLPISSLDHDLPKVTLEFFLKYEGAGSPIKWEVNDCGNTLDIAGRERESTMCVQADIGLKDGRAARVIVSVGKARDGAVSDPTIYGVSVTYPGGMIHRLDHLRDLPVELHIVHYQKGPRICRAA